MAHTGTEQWTDYVVKNLNNYKSFDLALSSTTNQQIVGLLHIPKCIMENATNGESAILVGSSINYDMGIKGQIYKKTENTIAVYGLVNYILQLYGEK